MRRRRRPRGPLRGAGGRRSTSGGKSLRIKFEFQGGYGGLFAAEPLACDVEVDQLPHELRSKLMGLIENAGIMEAESGQRRRSAGGARDAYDYRLQIQDQGSQKSMAFNDASAPSEVRPLLQFLQQLALERRKSGK